MFLMNCCLRCLEVRILMPMPIIAAVNIDAITDKVFIVSNVEVTGDPLEAACGAGMFVI